MALTPDTQLSPDTVFGLYLPLEERPLAGEPPEKMAPVFLSWAFTQGPNETLTLEQQCFDFLASYSLRNLLQFDTDAESLQNEIRSELCKEWERQSADVVPDNRELVYVLCQRLCGPEPLDESELIRFLRAAATVMFEHSCVKVTNSAAVTSRGSSGIPDEQDSFFIVNAQPENLLARECRRQALANSADPTQQRLAEMYALTQYAGRNAEELADLFDMPLDQVRAEIANAIAFVSDDVLPLDNSLIGRRCGVATKSLNKETATIELGVLLHRDFGLLARDLSTLSAAQLTEIYTAFQKVYSRHGPTREQLVIIMRNLSSRQLWRIVKDSDLNYEEVEIVRRIAEEKRASGDLKAQLIIDLLDRR